MLFLSLTAGLTIKICSETRFLTRRFTVAFRLKTIAQYTVSYVPVRPVPRNRFNIRFRNQIFEFGHPPLRRVSVKNNKMHLIA